MLAEELSYTVTASLWEYQGKGRWVFLTLPQDISAEIAFFAGGGKRRGRDREDRRERGGPGEGGDGMAVDEADEGRGGGGKRQRADEHDDRAD